MIKHYTLERTDDYLHKPSLAYLSHETCSMASFSRGSHHCTKRWQWTSATTQPNTSISASPMATMIMSRPYRQAHEHLTIACDIFARQLGENAPQTLDCHKKLNVTFKYL